MFTIFYTKIKKLTPQFLFLGVVLFSFLLLPYNTSQAEDILILRSYDFDAYNEAIAGFEKEFEDNPHYTIEILDLKGKLKEGSRIIVKFNKEHEQPVAVAAFGILAASLAKSEFENVPIVFCMVVNHERYDLSGPNISGVALELYVKEQFRYYKEVIPDLKDLGVIYDPQKSKRLIEEGREAAKKLGLNLITAEVGAEEEVASALEELMPEIDALWLIPDMTVVSVNTIETILENSYEEKVPLLCTSEALVRAGALAGAFPENYGIGQQAAKITRQFLDGPIPPAPGVIYPEESRLAINTDVAELMDVDIDRLEKRDRVRLYP
jgi:putative ABC transport system substrate-binding protein